MASDTPGLAAILEKLQRGPARSKLFDYLVKHHDRFAAIARKRLPWAEIRAELEAETGGPVLEGQARKTWWRVKQAVARTKALKAEAAAARKRPRQADMPSRFPAGLRPLEYTRAPPPLSKPAEPSGPASPTDRTPAQARADAQIARMKRNCALADGRKPTL